MTYEVLAVSSLMISGLSPYGGDGCGFKEVRGVFTV